MKVFLSAEWRKLILANYIVPPSILQPFVPKNTVLDIWNGNCYVSLVGFVFMNTKLKGISVPFHRNFEEVNLRFYVKYKSNGEWLRGVVFIKELVPKTMITLIANTLYGENYQTVPMKHNWDIQEDFQTIEYSWKIDDWQSLKVEAETTSITIAEGSEAEFITEHYWGYTKLGASKTSEYGVEHPRWQMYPIKNHEINVDFCKNYGAPFEFLNQEQPYSVFLAEGSDIIVREGRFI